LVVVAPHLDDGVLSAGGTILVHARAGGESEVVTVFAGSPAPGSLSPAAEELHRLCGHGDDLVFRRQDEDRGATGILGATSRFLAYLDAPYRRGADGEPRYGSLDEVRRSWDPDEQLLVDRVADDLVRLYPDPRTTWFLFPLAVGGHIDHQIVHRAGKRTHAAGYQVAFYEDIPYALSPVDLEAALAGAALTPLVTVFDEEVLARKTQAIGAYASQRRLLENLHIQQRAHEGRDCSDCVNAIAGGLSERSWGSDPGTL
jgi:LmbE family N-acetylglucosaminyl deacetylase